MRRACPRSSTGCHAGRAAEQPDRTSIRFEAANRGTLSVDERPLDAQVRLLRSFQAGKITRLDEAEPIEADVHVVAVRDRKRELPRLLDHRLTRVDEQSRTPLCQEV